MRWINTVATISVIVMSFVGALGPKGILQALPQWLAIKDR